MVRNLKSIPLLALKEHFHCDVHAEVYCVHAITDMVCLLAISHWGGALGTLHLCLYYRNLKLWLDVQTHLDKWFLRFPTK